MLALMPSTAMVFVDQTVLPVALPTIQKHLNATNVQLQWFVNAYLLLTAVLVLAGGKIGDWIGHRKTYALGMFIFAVASAVCGLSLTPEMLIGARGLQGLGAALMIPATTTLLMSLFPPSERGRATGIAASASSLFLILGPFIGGYFTEFISWRWIFWINLPIAVLGLFLIFIFVPPSQPAKHQFDIRGFIYFMFCSSSLVIILMQGREWGWSSLKVESFLAIFLISGILLLRREKKAEHPFLDLALFKHPIFRAVNISIFSIQFIMMIMVFRAIFFQDILGWSPMKTGLITLISATPVLFISPIGGYLSDKYTPKIPIALGFLLLIGSFIGTSLIIEGPTWMIVISLFIYGMGLPFIFTPSYASAMSSIPPTKAGAAFGTIATMRSLAATLGVAVLGAVIEEIEWHRLYRLVAENPVTRTINASILKSVITGAEQAQTMLQNLSTKQAQIVENYLTNARFAGFIYSHFILAAVLFVAFGFVFVLYHRKSTHHIPETPGQGWD